MSQSTLKQDQIYQRLTLEARNEFVISTRNSVTTELRFEHIGQNLQQLCSSMQRNSWGYMITEKDKTHISQAVAKRKNSK